MLGTHSVYTAIYDIESFMQVLGYLIIKYSRLEEVPRKNTPVLRKALLVFVDGSDSQEQKMLILFRDNHFEKLLKYVSLEFEVLKNLMHTWYHIIHVAYLYSSGIEFKYPYWAFIWSIDYVIEVLNVVINVGQIESECHSDMRLAIHS